MRITPIILAGGEGKRLAPISTPERPKPFVPLGGGASLLTRTCARATCNGWEAPVLIGDAHHRFALHNHARDAGIEPRAIYLESQPRNTALAVAVGVAATRNPEAMLAFLPADHMIADHASWRSAVTALATALGDSDAIGLLGQKAETHNPEYGYMVTGQAQGACDVQRFIEKPAIAPTLKAGEQLLCNMGQFVGRRHAFADALRTHAPALWRMAQSLVAQAQRSQNAYLLPPLTEPLAATPFDRAVLENHTPLIAVACDVGWEDLGTPSQWQRHQKQIPIAPPRTERPWGYFQTLAHSPIHVEKELVVFPGCRISLQRHMHRDERWHVIEGEAHVSLADMRYDIAAGAHIDIPKGQWHRLANAGGGVLRVRETQQGLPDEADIERLEDDYGRI